MPPVLTSGSVVGDEESARLFDAAYDGHAPRARAHPSKGGLCMRRSRWMRLGILVAALSIGHGLRWRGRRLGGGTRRGRRRRPTTSSSASATPWPATAGATTDDLLGQGAGPGQRQGRKVIAISKNGGPTEQIQDLQNLISQGADAIVINPSDQEKLNPVIKQATDKKIVVVAVDQAVSEPTAYVATNDQVAYGRLGAEWLAKDLGGKGNVLYMRGIDAACRPTPTATRSFQEVMAQAGHQDQEVFTSQDFTKARTSRSRSSAPGTTTASGPRHRTGGQRLQDHRRQAARPGHGADNNQFIQQLLDGTPGAAVTNPAVIGGVGTAIALDVLSGKTSSARPCSPRVWDAEQDKATLEANSFPDRDATFSSAVSVTLHHLHQRAAVRLQGPWRVARHLSR